MQAEDILKDLEKPEDILEKRIEKIANWLKNPYNFAFLSIIIFAIAIRLYYFILTKDQAVWWDEAEYLNMARAWAFGLEYNYWFAVRPVLFSLITAIFFKIAYTEFLPRAFVLLLSIASVIGVYYLGKEVYNKKVGLISCFFASVFYLSLFFTYRIQMDIPSLAFFTFSAFLFYKYFKNNSNHKALYWAAALIAIGTMFKQNAAFLLPAILIYLLITEKLSFLRKKEIWIAALIFFLVLSPYLIWGYAKFGGFILTQGAGIGKVQNYDSGFPKPPSYWINGINNFKDYINRNMVQRYLSWPFVIIFLLGLASMYKLLLGFDVLIKRPDKKLKRDLYLLLIFAIPIILNSLLINHFEERYIIHSFPAIFMISGFVIIKGYDFIKKRSKVFAIIFLIFLLSFFAYFQVLSSGHTDDLIKAKLHSYGEVKAAGLWLKENSEPQDIILTNSIHQIAYYAERKTIIPPGTAEKFESLLESDKNVKYLVVSIIQKSPDWAYTYPQEKNLTAVQAYFADPNNQQPILIIYKL